jgi:hypothetical protein
MLRIRDDYTGSRIPDPNFSNPDPGSRVKKIPDPGSASKNLNFLTQKTVSKLEKNELGCSSQIPDKDPDFLLFRIPNPEVKKVPDPRSGSTTLRTLGHVLAGNSQYPSK